MKQKQKIIGIVLILIMLISSIQLFTVKAVVEDITCDNETGAYFTVDGPNSEGASGIKCFTPTNAISGKELTEVTVPRTIDTHQNITYIGEEAFADLENITSVTIESSAESWFQIEKRAFANCKGLKTIIFPSDLTMVDETAFEGCTSLEYLDLSNTNIADSAAFNQFWLGCANLKTIKLSSEYKGNLLINEFDQLSKLENIIVEEGNKNLKSVNGVLYNADMTKLLAYPANKTDKKYEVPSTVTEIVDFAFFGSQNLEEIILPDSVTTIGTMAFKGCQKLQKVVVPDSVKTIEEMIAIKMDNSAHNTNIKFYCRTNSEMSAYKDHLGELTKVLDDNAPQISEFVQKGTSVVVEAKDADDGVGLSSKPYSFDDGKTWTNENKKEISEAGIYKVIVKDALGNKAEKTLEIKDLLVEEESKDEVKDENKNETKDETTAKDPLPQTGMNNLILIITCISIIVCFIFNKKFKKYNY